MEGPTYGPWSWENTPLIVRSVVADGPVGNTAVRIDEDSGRANNDRRQPVDKLWVNQRLGINVSCRRLKK